MDTAEEFRPIEGSNGRYMVSNKGNVLSLYVRRNTNNHPTETYMPHFMEPNDNGHGYLYVDLRYQNKRIRKYIHRAVAEAFMLPIPGKHIVNHIDFDTRNNSVSNLEWCTQKENILHSRQNMCHPKNVVNSNTGYKYISLTKKNLYRVAYKQRSIDKRFKTLREAIAFRKEALGDIGFAE